MKPYNVIQDYVANATMYAQQMGQVSVPTRQATPGWRLMNQPAALKTPTAGTMINGQALVVTQGVFFKEQGGIYTGPFLAIT